MIALSDRVGRKVSAGNRLADTLQLKLGLERLGYYEPDPRGFIPGADDGLWHGLQSYQRDRGLDVDGIALPDGPTVSALNSDLDSAPRPSLIRGSFEAPLSADTVGSNRRAAQSLSRSTDIGDMPAFLVAALRSRGDSAPAEIVDLVAQTHKAAPEQARKLVDAIGSYLGDDDIARFDSALHGQIDGWRAPPARDDVDTSDATDAAITATPAPGDLGAPSDERVGSAGNDPRFGIFVKNLGPREGGYADRKGDFGGPTYKGLSKRLLDDVREKYPERKLPSDPRQVSDEDRNRIFRDEAYERLQIHKWADTPGLEEAAPKLAEQMFDAGILHNPKKTGQWLQEALDEHLGTDLQVPTKDGLKAYDGIVGSRTRAAIEQAVKDGKAGDINDAVAEKREAYVRKLPDFDDNPGWIPRIRSFRLRR